MLGDLDVVDDGEVFAWTAAAHDQVVALIGGHAHARQHLQHPTDVASRARCPSDLLEAEAHRADCRLLFRGEVDGRNSDADSNVSASNSELPRRSAQSIHWPTPDCLRRPVRWSADIATPACRARHSIGLAVRPMRSIWLKTRNSSSAAAVTRAAVRGVVPELFLAHLTSAPASRIVCSGTTSEQRRTR